MLRRLIVLNAGLPILLSCQDGRGSAGLASVVDTVGSAEVVTNRGHHGDTVSVRRSVTIGEIDGQPEYTFGSVSSVAADRAGRIYVSDAMADEIRVYDHDGRFLQRIGRRGDGPGEFRTPTGLAFDSAGLLYVRDETRVQQFTSESPGGVASEYLDSRPGVAYAFSLMSSRVDADGRFYFPVRSGRIPEQRYSFLVTDAAGVSRDTLRLPESVRVPSETAISRTGASGGRMVQGLSQAPFAARPSWDVTPEGNLLLADGASYEIAELNPRGDTVRLIRRDVDLTPVPDGEYEDSLRAIRRRIAEAPVPLEKLEGVPDEIRRGQLPRSLPAVLSLHIGTDGRIWVQRWPSGTGSVFDVFSRDGIYQRTVSVPDRLLPRPAPVFTATSIYAVVSDPDTDVQQVAVFSSDR